ncbi:hypothetical protein KEM55_000988 [Ascosphaera atra]|nr:hypothetical protein KEM55_000988 [Ascosphaera atra]
MLRPGVGGQNLNAQAMEATVEIIRDIVERSAIRVTEVYIDTIGNPASYQKRLEQIFPALKITVAKKADSLYPCVSAASVCAKVTRDIALEVSYDEVLKNMSTSRDQEASPDGWGSGYPSDSKCVNWLKRDMHSLFGWGNECRFSWGTAKEMLEGKKIRKVEWPEDDDAEGMRMTDLFAVQGKGDKEAPDELRDWFGCRRAEIL